LKKKSFQEQLAQAIAAAVKRYVVFLAAREESPSADSIEKPSKKKGG